jgi:hypothetical protein
MKKVFEKVPIKKIVFPAPQYFTQIYTANELLKDPVFYPMSDPLDNQKFLYFAFGHPKFFGNFSNRILPFKHFDICGYLFFARSRTARSDMGRSKPDDS